LPASSLSSLFHFKTPFFFTSSCDCST
jgi:hypothetical protein